MLGLAEVHWCLGARLSHSFQKGSSEQRWCHDVRMFQSWPSTQCCPVEIIVPPDIGGEHLQQVQILLSPCKERAGFPVWEQHSCVAVWAGEHISSLWRFCPEGGFGLSSCSAVMVKVLSVPPRKKASKRLSSPC